MRRVIGCVRRVKVEGVESVHELHVWQLTATRVVATLHIRCRSVSDYMTIAVRVKQLFHDEAIHSVTVQPEFSDMVCPRHEILVFAILFLKPHPTHSRPVWLTAQAWLDDRYSVAGELKEIGQRLLTVHLDLVPRHTPLRGYGLSIGPH